MNKEYICKKHKISELLDEIDNFKTIIEKFNAKHNSKLVYSIEIKQVIDEKPDWVALLKVNKNERTNSAIS